MIRNECRTHTEIRAEHISTVIIVKQWRGGVNVDVDMIWQVPLHGLST